MKIQLLKDWNHNLKGKVLDVGDGVASELVRRGIAEKVVVKVSASARNKSGTARDGA